MSTISSVLNAQPTNSTTPAAGGASSKDSLTSEQTFLKILVAQIQNQDPTSPTDPTQFVSQLTQYSALEQLIGINQGVQKLETPTPTTPTPPATT